MMIRRFRHGVLAVVLLALICILPGRVRAEAAQAQLLNPEECITDLQGVRSMESAFDGVTIKGSSYPGNIQMTLENEKGIGSLYLIFDREYSDYKITNNDTGDIGTWGDKGFLHEFVDLEGFFGTAPKSVTINFQEPKLLLNEMEIYGPGEVPDHVQKWEEPEDQRTDLLLFSTHADDEQLFFGGILPYYAGELGYRVQVVYLTNHRNLTNMRCHEALDGLWKVGVTRYPVFGPFADYYTTKSLKNAYDLFNVMGTSGEELMTFMVKQLRKYKPMVAIGHDLDGEYGHGMHMLYADLLLKASTVSGNPAKYPKLADKYGVWEVPKIYFHLYPENEIVLDWDKPLERFNGMTAYEVTKNIGFPCHVSQQKDFLWYMLGADKATEVKEYGPCYYGLYSSLVGPDVQKNDFFENVYTYDEQERIAEEEAARAAEEQRLAEEAAEQARLAKLAEAEAFDQAQRDAAAARTHAQKRNQMLTVVFVAAGLIALLALASYSAEMKRRKNK